MHPASASTILIVCLSLVCGCTMGPKQIREGRLHYNDAIQRTFQEEMLLNLVRLKYREIPEFLKVGGIAAQYSFDGSASASLKSPQVLPHELTANGRLARSEKPTISYIPARGEEFQKGLLAPIDVQSLQLLSRTGWSWERILRTTVQFLNEVDNATSAGGPTPDQKPDFEDFKYLAKLLRELQIRHQVELAVLTRPGTPKRLPIPVDRLDGEFVLSAYRDGFSLEESGDGLLLTKDESYVALVVHPAAKHSAEMQEIARLLNLEVDYHSAEPAIFDLDSATEGRIMPALRSQGGQTGAEELPVPGAPPSAPPGRTDIVVSTRSLLEVMFYLSQGIAVPFEHMQAGLVTLTEDEDGNPFDWREMTADLIQICSSKKRPKTAAVAVKFKGYWFYIDDRDLNSQSTFTLLVELFGIEVQAGGGGGFLYTLSVGG